MSRNHFHHSSVWQVVLAKKQAEAEWEEIQEWAGVVQYPSEFEVPPFVDDPVDKLALFHDGIKCGLDDGECPYVCQGMDTMKVHWRKKHGFSAGQNRGGSGMLKREEVERRISEHYCAVRCQRFFVQKEHSQYFEVRSSEEQSDESVRQSKDEEIWSQAWEQASQHYDRIRSDDTIRPGEIDEVNPWLRRTGWIPYLKDCDCKDILRCIRELTVDEEIAEGKNKANDNERATAAIWEAMGELVSASQDTVSRSRVMLRFEAICTEAHQNIYRPLEPYQNRDDIGRQGRQDRAFERMMAVARSTVNRVDESSDTESDSTDTDSRAEGEEGKLATTEIQEACLLFCIELLNQTIHNREYDMALVCGLAALGVNPSGRGFRGADTYPSMLSAVIKVAHFMIVQQAERLAQPTTGEHEEFSAGRSPCEFEDSGYESERAQTDSSEGRRKSGKSSFEWVRKMMDRFMVRGCGSPMQWMLDLRGDTLEYKAVKFNIAEFRGMVGQVQQATRRALLEDLMFATDGQGIPAVPWQHLYDDLSNDEAGWSFIRDQRSRLPVDGQSWLHERIGSRLDLRQQFIRAGTASGIDREQMRDWLRQVAAFCGKLLVLMHMTGGQPARGPEILSVWHCNTVQGGYRNLFIEDGMVVFVTRYHKGYEVKGDVKIIHRYLPREVGELVVWYLWLVLPFVQQIQAMVWQQETISDHLWPADADGRKWTTERMKHELQRVSEAGLGQSINVAGYRQIAITISRRWIRKGMENGADKHSDSDWLQDNLSDDIADEQATHSPHVAGAVYARDTQELAAAKKEGLRGLKRKRCPFEGEAEEARTERQVALRRMDAVAELQWMMRKKVTMRSVQGEAMHAIQQGESPIVVVMPTGAGKSVLFMLLAFVQVGRVSIVVVPLKALRADIVVRCRKVNIRCAVWEHGQAVDGASIVLVTPEKAVSPAFGTFISQVRQTQRLDQIVIDECYQLGKLAFAETQMLLLTATLLPSEEQTLFDRMYWRRQEVRLIRASTVRKNIEYSVIDRPAERSKRIECLSDLVECALRDESQLDGKVVVMCESKLEISAIVEAGMFPCEPFHADMTEERKEEVLEEFWAGTIHVVVASGSFNMGIDIAGIRLIVHMDKPRNIRDYGQGSGRAGRDGLASRAIIIRGRLGLGDDRVKRYIDRERQQCRRIDIDEYLDDDCTRQRCVADESWCDWC
ncbi:hypothetical protein Q7P35_011323 [Cladosporium inversicolor]